MEPEAIRTDNKNITKIAELRFVQPPDHAYPLLL